MATDRYQRGPDRTLTSDRLTRFCPGTRDRVDRLVHIRQADASRKDEGCAGDAVSHGRLIPRVAMRSWDEAEEPEGDGHSRKVSPGGRGWDDRRQSH
jgi:hypothetical protein